MNKLESLTPCQQSKLAEYRDKWMRIGLATGPSDTHRARLAIDRAYAVAGLEPPRFIVRLRDPIEGAIAAVLLKAALREVGAQVRAQVWDQVRAQVQAQVGDQVRDQVGAQVWDQVWDQVGAQVWAQVRAQVWDQVWGNHDAGWLGYIDFFRSACDIKCAEKLAPLMDLCEVCGWWAPYEGVAIIQDRPESIKWDDQKRLHCEDGPSVAYSSGFGVYSWHGLRVPKEVICDEPTMARIGEEENAEHRRVLIERMGYEAYFENAKSKTIDRDFVPLFVGGPVMPRMLIEDGYGNRYLYGTDGSTERCYVMPVLAGSRTCREAHQSICGLDETKCVAQS